MCWKLIGKHLADLCLLLVHVSLAFLFSSSSSSFIFSPSFLCFVSCSTLYLLKTGTSRTVEAIMVRGIPQFSRFLRHTEQLSGHCWISHSRQCLEWTSLATFSYPCRQDKHLLRPSWKMTSSKRFLVFAIN